MVRLRVRTDGTDVPFRRAPFGSRDRRRDWRRSLFRVSLRPARRRQGRGRQVRPGGSSTFIGTPTDPPPQSRRCLASALVAPRPDPAGSCEATHRPSGPGTAKAIQRWDKDTLGRRVPLDGIAVCVGTKEFVGRVPQLAPAATRRGATPSSIPLVAYPTYEMGAQLAGLRPVPVPLDDAWRLDLAAVDAAERGPGPAPVGQHARATRPAGWTIWRTPPVGAGTAGILVFSDECYVDFTWAGPPRTVLGQGDGRMASAAWSPSTRLSKRSNMAGMRVGLVQRRPRPGDLPARGPQARRLHGPGPRPAGGGRGPGGRGHVDAPAAPLPGAVGPGPGHPGRHRGRAARFLAAGSTCGPPRPEGTAGPGPGGWPTRAASWCRRDRSTVEAGGRLCPLGHGGSARPFDLVAEPSAFRGGKPARDPGRPGHAGSGVVAWGARAQGSQNTSTSWPSRS